MKRLLIILVALVTGLTASAGEPKPLFKKFADNQGVQYTYLSSTMLNTIKGQTISGSSSLKDTRDLIPNYENLDMVEIIKVNDVTKINDFNEIIKKIVKDEKLQEMSYQSSRDSLFSWYVESDGKGDDVKRILLLRWKGWTNMNNFTGIYIVGKITKDMILRLVNRN